VGTGSRGSLEGEDFLNNERAYSIHIKLINVIATVVTCLVALVGCNLRIFTSQGP
jgi:hypothetical protein